MANPFVHVELATTDIDKAKSFYQVNVDDVAAATATAKSLGATIVREVTEAPNAGSFSIIVDPPGAALGLWQPLEK